jgi:hypothetical protein
MAPGFRPHSAPRDQPDPPREAGSPRREPRPAHRAWSGGHRHRPGPRTAARGPDHERPRHRTGGDSTGRSRHDPQDRHVLTPSANASSAAGKRRPRTPYRATESSPVSAFLLAVLEKADHLGDPHRALLGASFGGVDPPQEGGAVELGQRVEEHPPRPATRPAPPPRPAPSRPAAAPSGVSTTSTVMPSAGPQPRLHAGPRIRTTPPSATSSTPRTPRPATVPVT